MARAPFQVLVYPYRQVNNGEFEYALLKRSDSGYWQGVAGAGEDNESILEAARRETCEETGLREDSFFFQLDTIEPIPVTEFKDSCLWGDSVYVIPQYCFGVSVTDGEIVVSREHTDYKWLKYEEAHSLLRYDGNKTALWELDRKLKGLGPRD
ncbi:MAG: NUDIX pyrophosphatase [Chloroflexi bacterium]|nr:NUDIX pyrophosphatase [Chloroflexota bacterium]